MGCRISESGHSFNEEKCTIRSVLYTHSTVSTLQHGSLERKGFLAWQTELGDVMVHPSPSSSARSLPLDSRASSSLPDWRVLNRGAWAHWAVLNRCFTAVDSKESVSIPAAVCSRRVHPPPKGKAVRWLLSQFVQRQMWRELFVRSGEKLHRSMRTEEPVGCRWRSDSRRR